MRKKFFENLRSGLRDEDLKLIVNAKDSSEDESEIMKAGVDYE